MTISKFYVWLSRNIVRDKFIEQFINDNYHFVKNLKKKPGNNHAIALIEANHAFTTLILYSIICRFKLKNMIQIYAYRPLSNYSFKDRLSILLFSKFRIDNARFRPFRILKSMGVRKIIMPRNLKRYSHLAVKNFENLTFEDKYSLLTFEINQIRVGDIFYDWHLRLRTIKTVDFKSKEFEKDFVHFISNFYWWCDYMQSKKIESVFVSHSCSDLALPARVGLRFGAKVYYGSYGRMYKLTTDRIFSDLEFIDYIPGQKVQFGYEVDLNRSRKEIENARSGKITIVAHSTGSGYTGESRLKLIQDPEAFNVLIACHCFSDPPHSYGDTLFPDINDWLEYIGEFSKKSNYVFYLKPHPGFWDSDKIHFSSFLKKFPNIIEVPPGYSNLELFKQGIKTVLTVNGTIAFEAAYEGILVVNASLISPHMNYRFSISPKSVSEFNQILIGLPEIIKTWTVNKSELEHFFDIHHIRKTSSTMFGKKTFEFYDYIGGHWEQFLNSKVFDYWLNKQSETETKEVSKKIESFLEQGGYMLN